MKALVCLSCCTIRSPKLDRTWTPCDCGQAAVRWTDPQGGIAEVWAVDRLYVRLLGLHNQVLMHPIVPGLGNPGGDAGWRHLHQLTCSQAEGYLFHSDRRDCWAVVTYPGESSDVTFVEQRPSALRDGSADVWVPGDPVYPNEVDRRWCTHCLLGWTGGPEECPQCGRQSVEGCSSCGARDGCPGCINPPEESS